MHPARRNVVILSFEGPDRYSSVGGLATRVTELAYALGRSGSATTLLFVGDPQAPAVERIDNNVEYRRWSQWISAYHPAGVYDAEDDKVADFTSSVPAFVIDEIVVPALGRGEHTTVIAEEWQTIGATVALDALARERGIESGLTIVWNANNTYRFESIDWPSLVAAAHIMTISKYMKFELAAFGVSALVVPNGIPGRLLESGVAKTYSAQLEAALPHRPVYLKVGRFDLDKRWAQAVVAVADLRASGIPARLIVRGAREAYGDTVREMIREAGLSYASISSDSRDVETLIALLAAQDADVVEFRSFVPEELLLALYHHADAVLANSGKEPFGLVGLEVMAAGGLAVTGSTGEEYAEPFVNAIVCDTGDGAELAAYLRASILDPASTATMADAARATVQRYTWSNVLRTFDRKLDYIAATTR